VNTSGGGCIGTVANGDYKYEVSTTSGSVNWKFIPLSPIAGSTLAIITVKTSTGGYIGYTMTPSGSNFIFSQIYPSSTALTFYFTYRIGNTNMERNSSATPHTYTVGTTCNNAARLQNNFTLDEELLTDRTEEKIFPNPVREMLNVPAIEGKENNVRIQDVFGKLIAIKNVSSTGAIDVSALPPGCYLLMYTKDNQKVMRRFLKE
jgi:hypothetical protein